MPKHEKILPMYQLGVVVFCVQKAFFAGFHGLGSYLIRRHVLEIPYRINRYESEYFKIEFLDLGAYL